MLVLVALYGFFALAFVVNKATLAGIASLSLVAWRLTVSGLVILAVGFFSQRRITLQLTIKTFTLFSVVLFFNIACTNVLEILALPHVFAAKAALIYTFSPFVSIVLSFILYRQKLSLGQWIGLCIGISGVSYAILASWPGCARFSFTIADGMLVGAAITTVFGWAAVQRLVKDAQDPFAINGWSMLIVGITLLCVQRNHLLPTTAPIAVGAGIVTAALLAAAGYMWYSILLKKRSLVLMTFASFTTPLWTAIFGLIFLHEPITCALVISMIGVYSGLYLFYKQEIKRTC